MKKSVIAAIMIMFLCSPALALNLDSLEESKPAPAPAVSDCQDDPRLDDLNALITEAQKGPLANKVTLSPERFFKLRPQIIEAIGYPNIIVCPNISIVAGIPSQPVPVDFFELLKKYEWAMRADDMNEIKRLRNTFSAAPMPAQAAASLGAMVRGGDEEARQWVKKVGVRGQKYGFSGKTMGLLYLDLFHAFGGKIDGDPAKVVVLVDNGPCERPEVVSIVANNYRDHIVSTISSYGFKTYKREDEAIKAAKIMGIIK